MWRDDAYLLDMLIAAQRVMEFRRDLIWDEFRQSHLHHSMQLPKRSKISERPPAKFPKKPRPSCPPFRGQPVIAMRHRIAHDYFRLDLLRVWEIAVHDVPALIAAIEPHVPPEKA